MLTTCILYGSITYQTYLRDIISILEPLAFKTCLVCQEQLKNNTDRLSKKENIKDVDLRCIELKVNN